jgi:opacity protein-like surface antigen
VPRSGSPRGTRGFPWSLDLLALLLLAQQFLQRVFVTASTNQNESAVPLTVFIPGAAAALINSTGTLSAKTDFIGTLTSRFGYTQGRAMIYAKGGAAWAHDRYSFNGQVTDIECASVTNHSPPLPNTCDLFNAPVTTAFNFNASETRLGWTVGGGLEWAFWDNWSAKLEYDYLDFGTRNVTFTDATFGSQTIGVRQHISD